ncbi:MAG TPA: CHC2 zinc finger domain-containing protein, partial [Candidatus Sulfotelmatobacter sp.]|nr:CHC2 zinc finger domain-containing protein [Candidatus Sulfotelmatobacter sp.]
MSNWLDFKSIKRSVTLASLLRHYHVKLRRSGKDQYRGCCPIHHGDSRDAFHVNLARNVFHCFACGAGGTVLDFVAAKEGCSLFEAAQTIQSMTCSTTPLTLTRNEKELVTERRRVCLPLNFTLTGIDYSHPYLAERGIPEKTAAQFGVGFYAGPGLMHGRLVIPIHNADGELIAYCGRSVDQTQPRYRVPSAFAKSEILFNMHRAVAGMDNSVVIVEGFFDCMKVHQGGVPSVVGLMGSVLYEPQRRILLERFHHVVLMLDGDQAGRKGSAVIAEQLRPHCSVRVLLLPNGVQPDQLPAKDIGELLKPFATTISGSVTSLNEATR